MKKYILNPLSMLLIGGALGIAIKLLDVYAVGSSRILEEAAYMFSDIPVWILLGVLISIYSDTKKKAMLNIFPFCAGMLAAYYVTAELTNAVYGWSFIKAWAAFSCVSPVFAYFTWQTKEKGTFPKIIAAGIVLTTLLLMLLLEHHTIPDCVCLLAIAYVVFFHKVKRPEEKVREEKS